MYACFIFITGAGRECYSFSPPSCVIPGSALGSISIFGMYSRPCLYV